METESGSFITGFFLRYFQYLMSHVFSALQERLTLPPLTIASEFYTHDEMEEAAKFKKVTKKKRKLRKKTVVKADDLLGLEDEPGKDLSSRYLYQHGF